MACLPCQTSLPLSWVFNKWREELQQLNHDFFEQRKKYTAREMKTSTLRTD